MEGANQESPFKLPLAPTVSSDRLSRNAATFSGRRGSSIFSPAKTLDQTHSSNNNHTKLNLDPSSSDSDPPHPITISAGGVNATTQLIPQNPPPAPPQEVAKTRPPTTAIRYKECLKNHAANMGGHALDGCGEFMPGDGEEDSPEFLRCAACDCHRNFHRREVEGQPQCYNNNASYTRNLASAIPTHHHHHHHRGNKDSFLQGGFASNTTTTTTPRMMSFGGGNLGNSNYESSSDDLNNALEGSSSMLRGQSPKKRRFRTKFSQEQKDKMHEFASKLGWRIQRQDQEEVTRFCDEVGLRRQVLKVWMHNNKQQQQAMKRKSSSHEENV